MLVHACIVLESFKTDPALILKLRWYFSPFPPSFFHFFWQNKSSVQTHKKPAYSLFAFEKG